MSLIDTNATKTLPGIRLEYDPNDVHTRAARLGSLDIDIYSLAVEYAWHKEVMETAAKHDHLGEEFYGHFNQLCRALDQLQHSSMEGIEAALAQAIGEKEVTPDIPERKIHKERLEDSIEVLRWVLRNPLRS